MSSHAHATRALRIDEFEITDDGDCYVIAEIGHNHQGSVEKARQLFDEAKACGAHAVKLQKRDNRGLYTREMYNKPYENENSYGATYGEHREALEFGKPGVRGAEGLRGGDRHHVLRHGVRPRRAPTSWRSSTCPPTRSPRRT